MDRLLTLFAALVAGCVLLLLPGIAAFTGYQSTSSILDTEAEINARLVSQVVNVNPELWKAETLRLEELLRRRPGDKTPESRAVLDLQHRVISEAKDELAGPLIEKRDRFMTPARSSERFGSNAHCSRCSQKWPALHWRAACLPGPSSRR